MATQPLYPLVTAAEFLEFNFGDRKAELDNGVIRMMAGGTVRHAEVQGNIFAWLRSQLRGSGCRAYGSDIATQTHDQSIRYPDVSAFCRDVRMADDSKKSLDDPCVIFEVLSAGTARTDLKTKMVEYQALPSVDTIVFVDIAAERVRIVQRTGPHGWNDTSHDQPTDVALPSLKLTIPHEEIFARD
jgi:Uma2 family endonuclease